MKQRRYIQKQWERFIEEWKTSGQSAAHFCRLRRIPLATFYARRAELAPKPKKESPFVIVQSAPKPAACSNGAVRVNVDGIVLEFHHDTDPSLFRNALAAALLHRDL